MILAFDTATDRCSVALSNGSRWWSRHCDEPRQHARRLLPMVQEVMAEAQCSRSRLDAIAVTQGPGSFTGLRIGIGTAQGLAFSLGIPVIPVSTLRLLATSLVREAGGGTAGQQEPRDCLVLLDARMGEVYTGCYHVEEGVAVPRMDDCLLLPAGLEALLCDSDARFNPSSDRLVGGSGLLAAGVREVLRKAGWANESLYPDVAPMAADLLTLAHTMLGRGETCSAADLQPVYLRNNVAIKSVDRK